MISLTTTVDTTKPLCIGGHTDTINCNSYYYVTSHTTHKVSTTSVFTTHKVSTTSVFTVGIHSCMSSCTYSHHNISKEIPVYRCDVHLDTKCGIQMIHTYVYTIALKDVIEIITIPIMVWPQSISKNSTECLLTISILVPTL